MRLTQKLVPIFPRLHGHHFIVDHGHVKTVVEHDSSVSVSREAVVYATPMLLCLVCIEVSDIIFAFDSVPAVIAVTREPLLVYSAVIFAILGLRSLYFVLAAAQKYLVHLDKAVAALLFFIAFKLALQASNHLFHWPGFEISSNLSLMIILGTLAVGVIASLLFPGKEEVGEEGGLATREDRIRPENPSVTSLSRPMARREFAFSIRPGSRRFAIHSSSATREDKPHGYFPQQRR